MGLIPELHPIPTCCHVAPQLGQLARAFSTFPPTQHHECGFRAQLLIQWDGENSTIRIVRGLLEP